MFFRITEGSQSAKESNYLFGLARFTLLRAVLGISDRISSIPKSTAKDLTVRTEKVAQIHRGTFNWSK